MSTIMTCHLVLETATTMELAINFRRSSENFQSILLKGDAVKINKSANPNLGGKNDELLVNIPVENEKTQI